MGVLKGAASNLPGMKVAQPLPSEGSGIRSTVRQYDFRAQPKACAKFSFNKVHAIGDKTVDIDCASSCSGGEIVCCVRAARGRI